MATSGIQLLLTKLWGQVGRMVQSVDVSNKLDQPILSTAKINQLASELSHLSMSLPANLRRSDALRQGEQTSRFMGSGLEYEESRPYQIGDEIRRINWRLLAKTGQAYTKLYQEERQENWFILVDHRQTMRFGTRTRLKAEQAVRVAGYYLWMAQQSNIPVEGARLAEEVTFTPTFEGRGTFEYLMERFSLPCPPMTQVNFEPHINDVLLDLTHRIQPGSRVILISDFHDLNTKSVEILTALQQLADVNAIWIQDQAEVSLPTQQGVQLESMVNGDRYTFSDAQSMESYQAWSESFFQQQQTKLKSAGVSVNHLFGDAPLSQLKLGERHGR